MRWLKMLLILILCLCILFTGIMFTIHNTDKVAIDLLFIALPQASLSLWLIAFFVAGGVTGVILSSLAVLGLKARLRMADKRAKSFADQLEALGGK